MISRGAQCEEFLKHDKRKDMTMTGKLIALLGAASLMTAAFGANGDCEEHATSLTFSTSGGYRSVTLVRSYDPEAEEGNRYDDTQGVYYFKAKLERGKAYSVWTEGLGTNEHVSVTAYAADPSESSDKDSPTADFTELEEFQADQRLILYADEWDFGDGTADYPGDPKSWTYYFEITGDVGDSLTFYFQQGVVIPKGREENPQLLSPSESTATIAGRQLQIDNEYYMRARLQAGRMYWFGTDGGTTNCVLDLSIEGEEPADETLVAPECAMLDDPEYANRDHDVGYYVIPSETGYYSIVVSGHANDESGEAAGAAASASAAGARFSLSYRMLGARDVQEHDAVALDGQGSVELRPGSMNPAAAITNGVAGVYDAIIDEALCVFAARKGVRYVAETEGAATNLLMRVYDAKGNVVCGNAGDGRTFNVRCAFEAAADASYYVGVCQVLADEIYEVPSYVPVTLRVSETDAVAGEQDEWDEKDGTAAGATPLVARPAAEGAAPEEADAEGHGWHTLGRADWEDVFSIAARKDLVYSVRVSLEDQAGAFNSLAAEVFTMSGSLERSVAATGDVNAGSAEPLEFTASANATHYVRIRVAEGQGLDYPRYKVHVAARAADGRELGILTVNTHGADGATWSLNAETVKYSGGASVLVSGAQTVKFGAVSGFATPASVMRDVAPGNVPTIVEAYYSDTSDPKDDKAAGAVSLTLKNVDTVYARRTLWENDPADHFAFAGADGNYYDFSLDDVEGDGVSFSITNAQYGVVAENVRSVDKLPLPKTLGKYYLIVRNADGAEKFGGYALRGRFAKVGAIKLAKTVLSVKENAASAVITVNRTAKDGVVRVAYGTVAGTAIPGVDYVAQSGVLEWANGDNKAKNITVKLIPDLVPEYEGNKTFSLKLKAMDAADVASDEYVASFLGGDTCVVTLTEASRAGTVPEDAYAKNAPKLATVVTENVPLETGTFYGVLLTDTDEGNALTNGMPAMASVTLTASTANPAAISAKVALAGKTYSFSAKGWDDPGDGSVRVKTLQLVQKVNNVAYTNRLTVAVAAGSAAEDGAWRMSGGVVELEMNVPDANGRGAQTGIVYRGDIYRNNAKIQGYLNVVTNFTGYYTVALVSGARVEDGVPAGNGYLTLTVDNKGKAKVAGMLADGATKPSLSAVACAIVPDAESSTGHSMLLPVFLAKSPAVFGGTLRLYANEEGVVVVDSSKTLAWNNDNAALTRSGESGYRLSVIPEGGWYDTVFNLQSYYRGHAFEVGTADIGEFPKEALTAGYAYCAVQPHGTAVDLSGDAFSAAKQSLVKNGRLNDFAASVNPCNVQVKLARATGLVTGSFALWSETADGSAQRQITGIKHNGVLLLSRGAGAPLPDGVFSAGFFTQNVNLTEYNEATGRSVTRRWTFSAPFNLLGADQNPDWWAPDWGEKSGD
jgi:hypothetical protein